ncbi:MAG: hypothetical protein KGL79_05965 [Acidobacteriota bacterium]|nr:hypothetical protein [Acidobacteriota bacterium]
MSRRIAAPASTIFDVLVRPQRHAEFDGSEMLRGAVVDTRLSGVGDTFTIKMHRLGRDYEMINRVVFFAVNRLIAWEPAPGDLDTAGGDPERIGVASGYRWGYELAADGPHATVVTEFFDCVLPENQWILEREDGTWINGHNSVRASMTKTLALLERTCLGE